MHILPWQHKGHSVPDMFSCQSLVDFLNQKKASSSLAESGLSGTWHEIWHRVWLSHPVHISDRRYLGLLIWTLTPLELRYHNTSWQPEERLFFSVFFLCFLRTYTHTKKSLPEFEYESLKLPDLADPCRLETDQCSKWDQSHHYSFF